MSADQNSWREVKEGKTTRGEMEGLFKLLNWIALTGIVALIILAATLREPEILIGVGFCASLGLGNALGFMRF